MWYYLVNKEDGVILLVSDEPISNPYGETAFVTTYHEKVFPRTHFYDFRAQSIAEKTGKMIVLDQQRAKNKAKALHARVERAAELFAEMDPALQEFFMLLLELPESQLIEALRKTKD